MFGTFEWSVTDGGTLHLNGQLLPIEVKDNVLPDGSIQKYRSRDQLETQRYPVIWGEVEGTGYTLLDCFRRSLRELSLEDSIERVHVNRVLEGALFDYPNELDGDRVVIDLRHLTGWVDQTGLSTDHPRHSDGGDDRFSIITARTLPTLKVQHGDTSVRFFQSLQEQGDHIHELGIRQRWSLSLVAEEPQPLAAFMDTLASDVQDLVSIAVGRTANFDKVCLQHPALPKMSVGGTPIGDWREDITYYAQWSNHAETTDPVTTHDMYFTLDDLGGMEGIGRWLGVAATYRTELSRVMATRYSPHMFLEDRIMNTSAALDSFDMVRRQTGKHLDYAERIRHCVDLAGEPFRNLIHVDPITWAEHARETRNDLAHHRERFRLNGSIGEHLHSEQLFWLFAMCILRLADAPPSVFKSIDEHAQLRWLRGQARAGSPGA
ncbi:hypothetical protein CXG46_21010 [Nocardioides alpinus]|uniref:ApeA N-terminal domain-containing protein n=1 Tax=Nocardioides alpinus TaxID=748909 RepID=A0ABX4QT75_9ACTN|nr:hypothetical protein CXG46_21010 [Nocardioides alpinus]